MRLGRKEATRTPRRARASLAATLAAAALAAGPALGVEELEPSPGKATIYLQDPGNHEDMLRELRIERGKSAFMRTDYTVKRVSVGNPEVVDVLVLSPRELQLVAKAIGTTNVVLWDPQGQPKAAIDVHVGAPHANLESELRRVLGTDAIQIDSAGQAIVLKGTVGSPLDVERALSVAQAFLPDKKEGAGLVNLLEVGGDQQVMIEVIMAEMARSLRRRMGTNFVVIGDDGDVEVFSLLNNLISAQNGLIGVSDQITLIGRFFNGSDSYQFFFDVLHERGLGKVLAEPTLVARTGERANFLVGGEIPIPVAQGGAFGSITVEFKEFGVGVAFTPTVLQADRIHLAVTTEVSEPDFTLGTTVGGVVIPSFNTRRASTGVELGDGESFAIAGLLREDVDELVAKFPVLGDIPVLGALFRSSSFQKDETELVMIVTPRLVKPLGPGPHPLPTDHFVEPDDFEFYLLGRLEGRGDDAAGETADAESIETGGLIGEAGHRVAARSHEEMQ
jgi:pilus assembly protein CpaC